MQRRVTRLLLHMVGFVAVVGGVAPALMARGERVVPQVADGAGVIRTKLDISNPSASVTITRMKVFFFHKDGTPWVLSTTLGTANEFPIELGRGQVLRLETLGQSGGIVSGYAIVRDTEGNATESGDYQVAVSVFYEVLNGSRVTDTVSVSVGPPTLRWSFPVEIDSARNLHSGFALVNLSNEPNNVTLQLWSSFTPSSADASDGGRLTLTLGPKEQRAQFLNEPGLFPGLALFRGALSGSSDRPVAVLALLQTPTAGGLQYATLAAEYLDAQHSESYVFLPESSRLDADIPQVPFLNLDDSRSFDLYYQTISTSVRHLSVANGALLAGLGSRSAAEFSNLTAAELQALTFTAVPLELSDVSGNLAAGYTFAIRTSLGRLVKARVGQVVSSGLRSDLALQVYVYR